MKISPLKRTGIGSMAVLMVFLCCGQSAPQACTPTPQPSHTGAVVAGVAIVAGVVIGTVVLVEAHKHHHLIKGCVTTAASGGMELTVVTTSESNTGVKTQSGKVYQLQGDVARVKVGDVVQVHGDKMKLAKGATGEQTFVVKSIKKDYGACKVAPVVPAQAL